MSPKKTGYDHDALLRKDAEEALLFRKMLLEAVSETSVDGVLVVDNSGRTVFFNRRFTELWQIPQSVLDTNDDREMLKYAVEQLKDPEEFTSKVVYLYEHRDEKSRDEINFSDGRCFERYSSPLYDSAGIHHGRAWYFRDITKQKQTEESLRKSEERLRHITENISEVFWMADADINQMLYVSPGYEKVWGRTCGSLYEKPQSFLEAIHPEDIRQVLDSLAAQKSGLPFDHEYRIIMPDGSVRWIWDRGFPVPGTEHEGRRYVGVAQDITGRKQAEEEREAMYAQLVQSQKMEFIGRLAGGMAHDFNNMLSAIIGHAHIALMKTGPDNPLRADLAEIRKAADRSADLIRQLLTFARRQVISPRVLDLNETVAEMLSMIRRLIGENIDLIWIPGPNLWSVNMDPSQIDQILANLCVNARDAIAGIGKMTIGTKNCVFDKAYCDEHAGYQTGDYVMLEVSDNGCGMDKETFEHLFEPFFTTKEIGRGTGLGLSTVYGIIKQNKCFIRVVSEPEHGSTFRIYIPRHTVGADTPQTKGTVETPRGAGETILLVEDETMILALGRIVLTDLGYTVLTADTPGKAIRIAEEHKGTIHLLITDIIMPDMSGQELAGKLKSIRPNIRRLFMSGYSSDIIARHGVIEKDVCFIHKPFSPPDLAAKVREALGRHASQTPSFKE